MLMSTFKFAGAGVVSGRFHGHRMTIWTMHFGRHYRRAVPAPDPATIHPVAGQDRVVFLKPLVKSPLVTVGDYTYYDDPDGASLFEERNVLYSYGPERLVIGSYCALAEGVRFIMPGANHAMLGPSTFPFGIFGGDWADTMDLVMGAVSRAATRSSAATCGWGTGRS